MGIYVSLEAPNITVTKRYKHNLSLASVKHAQITSCIRTLGKSNENF